MSTKICLKCGDSFTAKRSTKKFCSDSCRVGYHQRGNRIDEALRNIAMWMGSISTAVHTYPDAVTEGHKKGLQGLRNFMDILELEISNTLPPYPTGQGRGDTSERNEV